MKCNTCSCDWLWPICRAAHHGSHRAGAAGPGADIAAGAVARPRGLRPVRLHGQLRQPVAAARTARLRARCGQQRGRPRRGRRARQPVQAQAVPLPAVPVLPSAPAPCTCCIHLRHTLVPALQLHISHVLCPVLANDYFLSDGSSAIRPTQQATATSWSPSKCFCCQDCSAPPARTAEVRAWLSKVINRRAYTEASVMHDKYFP